VARGRRWDDLAAGTRRRWTAAYGGEGAPAERAARAERAYEAGASLTTAQRGHAYTPSRPEDALRHPENWPRYLARPENRDLVNELARLQGESRVGIGPRGVKADEAGQKGGHYTYVVRGDDFRATSYPGDWSGSTRFRTLREAQREARRTGAPPGIVIIVREPRPKGLPKGRDWYGYRLYFARDYDGAAS
jgi:hypothetical protein